MSNETAVRHVHVRLLQGEKPRWCFVGSIFMEQCPKNHANWFLQHYSTVLRIVGL
jgi:hypothetical protein